MKNQNDTNLLVNVHLQKMNEAILDNQDDFLRLFCSSFVGKVSNPSFSDETICLCINSNIPISYKVKIDQNVIKWLSTLTGLPFSSIEETLTLIGGMINHCFDNDIDTIKSLWTGNLPCELLEIYLNHKEYNITVLDDELGTVCERNLIDNFYNHVEKNL